MWYIMSGRYIDVVCFLLRPWWRVVVFGGVWWRVVACGGVWWCVYCGVCGSTNAVLCV